MARLGEGHGKGDDHDLCGKLCGERGTARGVERERKEKVENLCQHSRAEYNLELGNNKNCLPVIRSAK